MAPMHRSRAKHRIQVLFGTQKGPDVLKHLLSDRAKHPECTARQTHSQECYLLLLLLVA